MSALQGIRILELAESPAGEHCGKLLADFGADVVKLERPGMGSPTRQLPPFAPRGRDPERSGLFAWLNTNKQSVALDLQAPEGRATLQQLLAGVDAVIDDHAPGWLAAVGIDPQAIERQHPQLVLCSITPYGDTPPPERALAQDLNLMHASGWGYHTPSGAAPGQTPLKGAGPYLASFEVGIDAALCVTAALIDRANSGLGRVIGVNAQAVLASRADYVLAQMVAGDMPVGPERTAWDLSGPAGIFPCREGFAYIWMSAPAHWETLRKLLGNPVWMETFPERWMELDCTPERVAECRRHVGAWLRGQDKHAAAAAAQQLGLTLVAVNDARDLEASPQYAFRDYFATVEHPEQGSARYPTVPYRLSATPARIATPAPLLGQHNARLAALAGGTKNRAGGNDKAAPRSGQGTAAGVAARVQANESVASTADGGARGPLAGLRVIELTKVWAGPCVGKLLAFLGAEVIRVESEDSLDVTRSYGVDDINNAPGFQSVNVQKLSVQINMKSEQGIALLLDLVAKSDLVVENLRPGAIERLGLGYAQLKAVNPDIVFVSMGMYGSEGPLAYQTGYAPCFAALGGLSALVGYEGEPPAGMNIRYADSTFGAMAAFAALVALYHRRQGGAGQLVDVSAVESMSSVIGDALMDYSLNGAIRQCDGNRHPAMAPHGAYPCQHGEWLSIAVADDAAWRALARCIGVAADDAKFATLAARKTNEAELDALIASWTARQGAAELEAQLQAAGVAAARSLSSLDLIADGHLWAQGFYTEVSDASGRARTTLGPAWRMSRAARVSSDAPRLGEHNAYVFGEILGLSSDRQRELAQAGVTR